MLPPLPRRGNERHNIAHPSRRVSLPRIGGRVGPRIDLFEVCSAFTRVAACTLALPPNRGSLIRRLQPLRLLRSCSGASGWSSSPGGSLTHWKAPPYHGARQWRTFTFAAQFARKQSLKGTAAPLDPWPSPSFAVGAVRRSQMKPRRSGANVRPESVTACAARNRVRRGPTCRLELLPPHQRPVGEYANLTTHQARATVLG